MRTSEETIRELERLSEKSNYRERGSGFGTLTVRGEFSRMTFNHLALDAMPNLLADLRDLAAMERERDEARAKNRELNRRAQLADAAAQDAKQCLMKLAEGTEKGTPWCSGSLGRALLVWQTGKQDEEIERLRAALLAITFTSSGPAAIDIARRALGLDAAIGGQA